MDVLTPEQPLALDVSVNPFTSSAALRHSNYSVPAGGTLVRLLDRRTPHPKAVFADRAMRGFITSSAFSCVAGKAAVASGGYRFGYYRGFPDLRCAEGLARDLAAFVAERPSMRRTYTTFVAVFDEPNSGNEYWFESALWRQLQRLSDLAAPYYGWDATVSNDAADPNFAFSFAGEAFFAVGMHPHSSRLSRRFFLPAIAFNAHVQFAEARRNGRFRQIQRLVRERELRLQGSVNPELYEFGTRSEARQYSGRKTEEEWRCPFRAPS